MLKEEIKELAQRFHPDIVKLRRHLHTYPELSFQEHKTAAFIRGQLTVYMRLNNIAVPSIYGPSADDKGF